MDDAPNGRISDQTPFAEDQLVSRAEVATLTGVSRQTVHDWIRRGHLTVVETDDGLIRLRLTEVTRFEDLRRIAAESHLRLSTVRGWADGGDGANVDGTTSID